MLASERIYKAFFLKKTYCTILYSHAGFYGTWNTLFHAAKESQELAVMIEDGKEKRKWKVSKVNVKGFMKKNDPQNKKCSL